MKKQKTQQSKTTKRKTIRKTYSLTCHDLDLIKLIKDKALNKKVVLSDSQVIRMGLNTISQLTDSKLADVALASPSPPKGRPWPPQK